MSVLLKNTTNSIWHAFNALYQEEPGLVNKSKLKVLTANIATLLDLYGVEKGLEHYRSTSSLNFEHFKYYLAQEVFSSLPNTLQLVEIRKCEAEIEEICWLVCRKQYLTENYKTFTEETVFKLFRIFCMLGDFISTEKTCEVILHSSETVQIVKQLMSSLGFEYETDNKYEYLNSSDFTLRFDQFLSLVEFKEYNCLTECTAPLSEAVSEMYQTYIEDVIKKGFLLRKGYLLPTLREYWFVLQPCELSYYKNSNEKELCGTIQLDSNCLIRPQQNNSSKNDKVKKFVLSVGERNFELGTSDHKTRMQWIAAFQLAITYSAGKDGFQRDLCSRRRVQRDLKKNKRNEEEKLRTCHKQEVEVAKQQLEKEKKARMAAEIQAKQLAAVAREDSRRVAELEDIKMTLERLLDDETQAKRDEEIVRALQARVLAEEWDKREELETLQEEQRLLLEQEREKREKFEITQKEKENQLKDAESKLKQLEEERQNLDFELKQARNKIYQSEETKEVLEARLRAISPTLREGERVRRTVSFMPSTRERPVTVEIRTATLKRSKV